MVLNPGKSHFMYMGKKTDDDEILNFNDLDKKKKKKNCKEVEILGIIKNRKR